MGRRIGLHRRAGKNTLHAQQSLFPSWCAAWGQIKISDVHSLSSILKILTHIHLKKSFDQISEFSELGSHNPWYLCWRNQESHIYTNLTQFMEQMILFL